MSACVLNNVPHKIQSCQGIANLCTDGFSWTFKNRKERKLYINMKGSTRNLNLRKMQLEIKKILITLIYISIIYSFLFLYLYVA